MSEAPAPPKRILLCRTDRLGDVILSLPCATLLKRMFPDSRICFWARSYPAPIIQMHADVDDIIEYQADENPAELERTLREHRFDAAIALYPERRVARLLKRAAIPIRAGIAYRWHSRLFTYRHREHRKDNLRHETEYNLNLTHAAFGVIGNWENLLPPETLFPLPLDIPQRIEARMARLRDELCQGDRRLIVLHPGGGGSAYRWPLQNYADLARVLSQQEKVALIISGVASERDLCRRVFEAAGEKCANLCGELGLQELAALLRFSDLLITNSTGPLHLGRAVGAKVIGLYPSIHAMSPRRWGPYGMPENALTAPKGQGIGAIGVDQVLQRAREILG
jgi:ADP-heptose:LPS heptosyltransferase